MSHHGSGLSSLSSVSQSLASLNSLGEDNDALYVNGRVPRGQFREYFLRPDTEADHRFLVPAVPRARVGRAPSLRSGSSSSSAASGSVRRSASISSRTSVPAVPLSSSSFVRAASGRSSWLQKKLLQKSLSMDDVLEESLNRTQEEAEAEQPSYYNVQYLGGRKGQQPPAAATSQLVLNRENLEQHERQQRGSGQEAPDPLSTSYLGHTLLTQAPGDPDSETDESKDSGAVSMGGVSRVQCPCYPSLDYETVNLDKLMWPHFMMGTSSCTGDNANFVLLLGLG